jgi:hypothetical protein
MKRGESTTKERKTRKPQQCTTGSTTNANATQYSI